MPEVAVVDGHNKGIDMKCEGVCMVCEDPPEGITVEESWNYKLGYKLVGRH